MSIVFCYLYLDWMLVHLTLLYPFLHYLPPQPQVWSYATK